MKFLSACFTFLLISQGYCQTVSKITEPVPDRAFFISGLDDIRKTAVFPLHINDKDIAFLTAGLSITASFIPADEIIFRQTLKNHNRTFDNVSEYILDPWGNGMYTLPVLGAAWLAGRISGNDHTSYTALTGAKTCILAMGASRVPKFLLQRHRPDAADPDAMNFSGPFNGFTGNYSMPSGHAFIVFSTVASMTPELKENKTLLIAMFVLASAVSLSRVYGQEHWASDAVGGAIAGYAFGRFIWRMNNWKASGRMRMFR